jgi:hypothetical protein
MGSLRDGLTKTWQNPGGPTTLFETIGASVIGSTFVKSNIAACGQGRVAS